MKEPKIETFHIKMDATEVVNTIEKAKADLELEYNIIKCALDYYKVHCAVHKTPTDIKGNRIDDWKLVHELAKSLLMLNSACRSYVESKETE